MTGSKPCEGTPVLNNPAIKSQQDNVVHRTLYDKNQYRPFEYYVPCEGWINIKSAIQVEGRAPTCITCIVAGHVERLPQ